MLFYFNLLDCVFPDFPSNLPGFFSIENKKKASSKYVAPIVSYDRECIQKL
jgi:hypothetical protein